MKDHKEMTVRNIRRLLFETNKFAVIGEDELTNKESRNMLFAKNQNSSMNVIDNGSHLLIWKIR
jgi:hypothetical protein